MKDDVLTFGKRMLGFMLILIAVLAVIHFIYSKAVLEHKIQYRADQQFAEMQLHENISILFLGASHTWQAANPQYIPGSFNLAGGANSFVEQYFKLQRAVELSQPKFIVLEIDLESFAPSMRDLGPLHYDQWYYASFVSIPTMARATDRGIPETTARVFLPFVGQGTQLLQPKVYTPLYRGWANVSVDYSVHGSDAGIVNLQRRQFRQERIDPVLLAYYGDILRLAESNNMTVILVKYPYSKRYDELMRAQNISNAEYYATILNATEAVTSNYVIFDYYSEYFGQPQYFADGDHLNSNGAEVFSQDFARKIERIDR